MAVISKFYNVIAQDDVIFIPDLVLAKCRNVNYMAMSADNLIELPEVTVDILRLICQCIENNGILNGISMSDIKDLAKAAKYLGCGDIFDALGKLLLCLIRGDHFEIRTRFSFEPFDYVLNDDDWEYDPMESLDPNNYLFNLFPLEVLMDILICLPMNKKKTFLFTFGQRSATWRVLIKCQHLWEMNA